MAVPSARNSGFDKTSNRTPGWAFSDNYSMWLAMASVAYKSSYTHDCPDRFCSSTWYSGLFNHDLVASCHFRDSASSILYKPEIGRSAFSNTGCFGRSVDAHEDQVGFCDGFLYFCRKEELLLENRATTICGLFMEAIGALRRVRVCLGGCENAVSSNSDNIVETRFIDGQIFWLPRLNACLVDVYDSDLDVCFVGGNGGGWAWWTINGFAGKGLNLVADNETYLQQTRSPDKLSFSLLCGLDEFVRWVGPILTGLE